MGFPREIQCDNGTSFTSILTNTFFEKFGIKVRHSSIQHPQSNPVERFHRTLKRILRVLCLEAGTDWETQLPGILLALRTIPHQSTGFSPAELVHGRNLRTPEVLLYEHWVESEQERTPVTEYMFTLLNRLRRCQSLAIERMEETRDQRKTWYDKGAIKRQFHVGDSVLVIATSKPNKLAVSWMGPGTIESQISETNYRVSIPGRKPSIYHVNMLKPYHRRPEQVNLLQVEEGRVVEEGCDFDIPTLSHDPNVYDFEEMIKENGLNERLSSLEISQLRKVLENYLPMFSNRPGLTDLVCHEIELISKVPVRSKSYRLSPRRTEILREEIKKMLEMKIIEPGESDYTSPMIVVEAPNKDPRPCIDYRRLNQITRTEFFPLPNIEENVEKVAAASYITLLDVSRGYWQIPLSPKSQRLAAFITPFGVYRPLRLPFGLRNAPFCFSQLMGKLLRGCEDFAIPFIDDIAIFSNTWEEHLVHLKETLSRLSQAKLTLKPSKCKFACAKVQYLGHTVGKGYRSPGERKIQAVKEFPQPKTKTDVRAFLGLTGYYSRYVKDYASIVAPLTDVLKGKLRKGEICWTPLCETAFVRLKEELGREPVLAAPDYTKGFILQCDSSNRGLGIVLSQRQKNETEHAVLYLSRKFTPSEMNYSVSEKECLAIVYAIKRLQCYLEGSEFVVESDHKPLLWLQQHASENPRLMRWALTLQPFAFQINHKAGKKHTNADSLSRLLPD